MDIFELVFGIIELLGACLALGYLFYCCRTVIKCKKRTVEILESINEKLTGKTDSNKNQTARKDGEGEKTYGRH